MLPDVRAVIFDLDGTLLDRRRSFEGFIRGQWERYAPLHSIARERYVETLIERDRDGYGPRHELFTGRLGEFDVPSRLSAALLDDYRSGFPQACVLFPDAAGTLAALRASPLRLGLITNGSVRMQRRKLECLALGPMFDTILISQAEGIHKPDRRIFHRALERLGAHPGEAVFVGDHPDVDIAGARAAGLRAVWRRDPRVPGMVEADAIIDKLDELLSLLGVAHINVVTLTNAGAIETARLRLILKTLAHVRADIDAMNADERAQLSPEWRARLDAPTVNAWTLGFTIVDRVTGVVVGTCGFKGPRGSDGAVEIAYGITPDQQGKGYATEAAAALVDYAFASDEVRVVRAHTLAAAGASTRMLTKCGFKNVGEAIDPHDGLVWRWERLRD